MFKTTNRNAPDNIPWFCVDNNGKLVMAPTQAELAQVTDIEREKYYNESVWDWDSFWKRDKK